MLEKRAIRSDYVSTSEMGSSEVDVHAMIAAGEMGRFLELTEDLIKEIAEKDKYFEGDDVFFMEVDIKFSDFLEKVTDYLSSKEP